MNIGHPSHPSKQLLSFIWLLLVVSPTLAQTTATWTGAGDGVHYNDAANWDIGTVPINLGPTTYNVVVPSNVVVTFDVGGSGHAVDDLTLNPGATLQMDLGTDFEVLGTATIDSGRIFADVGARAVVPVTAYTANAAGEVFKADGPLTLLDLSSMQTWSQSNFGGAPSRSVIASGGGTIDLSGLTTISNTSADDPLEFRTVSGGIIDLSSLTTIDGPSFMNIEASTFSLPQLGSTSGGGMSITRSAASTTNLPVLLSNNGGTWNVPAGGAINAPVMTQLRNTILNLETGGALNAPSLVDIAGSILNLGAGQTYNAPSVLAMDNARIHLTGGVTFATGATSYQSNIAGTVMSADGAGTSLDLSSIQVWSQDNFGGFVRRSVISSGGANLDLSGLTTIANNAFDDDIEFRTMSGGTIDLSSLTTIDGPVYLNVDTPNYSLPQLTTVVGGLSIDRPMGSTMTLPVLQSNDGGVWNVPESGSIDAPQLTQLTGATINIGDGGTLNVPMVSDLSGSTINLGANQTINSTTITSIDNSRIHLSGSATYGVSASSYVSNIGGTVFSADGPGTSLDLSSIQTWSQDNFGGAVHRTSIASGGGNIDLSGLTTITNHSGDDEIQFRTISGGTIDLSALTTVDGPVHFDIEGASYSLPALANVTGGISFTRSAGSTTDLPALQSSSGGNWNVPAGGSINAPVLTQLNNSIVNIATGGTLNAPNVVDIAGSIVNLGAGQTLTTGPLQQIDSARFFLTGGAQLSVADTHFEANVSGTMFSTAGTGSQLNLASIKTWTQNNFGGFARRSIASTGDAHIDLSGLETITIEPHASR